MTLAIFIETSDIFYYIGLLFLKGKPLSIQITAIDQDFGLNGEVNFELVQDIRGDWSKFDLDTITGLLTNNVVLDREEKAILQVSNMLCWMCRNF